MNWQYIFIIILIIWNLLLTRKINKLTPITEGMTSSDEIVAPIAQNATDMEAIKQLGDLAKQIYSEGKLVIPSNVEIKGNIKVIDYNNEGNQIKGNTLLNGQLTATGNIATLAKYKGGINRDGKQQYYGSETFYMEFINDDIDDKDGIVMEYDIKNGDKTYSPNEWELLVIGFNMKHDKTDVRGYQIEPVVINGKWKVKLRVSSMDN